MIGRVQVRHAPVNRHVLVRRPFDAARVAGDEVGGHAGMVEPTLRPRTGGKLADLNGLRV